MQAIEIMKKYYIFLIALGVVLLLTGIFFIKTNSTRNRLVSDDTALSAQYQANQANLSKCLLTIHETFSLAQVKTDAIDKVISDAVKGRYDTGSTAQPTGGGLISALREAYPDLSGLNTYDRVADNVIACRTDYASLQSKLLDMLRSYESYRNSGFIHSKVVSAVGYPNLVARVGRHAYTGEAALNQMHLIVTTSESDKASETGNQAPVDFGGK